MDLAFINDFRQFAVTQNSAFKALQEKKPDIATLQQLVTDLTPAQLLAVIDYLPHIDNPNLAIIHLIKAHYPLEREPCIDLSSVLTPDELKSLIFDLRLLAAGEINQKSTYLYHIKLDAVVDTLASMATRDEASFIMVVKDNKPLANMLFNWQYHPDIKNPQQQKLTDELLNNYNRYDWSNTEFKRLSLSRIGEAMVTCASDIRQRRFKGFVDTFLPQDAIALLDKLLISNNTQPECLSLITTLPSDAREMIILNYFTWAKYGTLEFKKQLLSLLSIERLLSIPNHIMALDYFFDDDLKNLSQYFCQILKEKLQTHADKTALLAEFVDTINAMQKDAKVLLINKLFLEWKDNVNLSAALIKALILKAVIPSEARDLPAITPNDSQEVPRFTRDDGHVLDATIPLNAHLYNVLIALLTHASMFWSSPITTFALLNDLNPEAFLAFYLYVLQHHPISPLYLEIERYFQDKSRHDMLIMLITNTPTLHANCLENLFYYIDDATLIKLTQALIEKIDHNPAFEHTFKKCLLTLSDRLKATYDDKADIHQWPNEALLAKHLLLNPECLNKLCERTTTAQSYTPSMLQGYLVASAETDLKLRIHKCLKLAVLDEKDIQSLAYQWLTYFQLKPSLLQQCFLAIESIAPTLDIAAKNVTTHQLATSRGLSAGSSDHRSIMDPADKPRGVEAQAVPEQLPKNNYLRIKNACYQFLHPDTRHMPTAAEALITEYLTQKLVDKHCFDPIKISNIERADKDKQLTLFEQLEGKDLEGLQFKTLVNLLIRAVDPIYHKHWERIADHINGLPPDHCFTIITTLITLNTDNSPIFNQKSWDWLTSLKAFDEVFPQLDNGILQWLFKNAPEDKVITLHPKWLITLMAQKKDLDIAEILLQLPNSPQLLYPFYQNNLFTDTQLTTFFIHLSQKSNTATHKIAIVEAIKQHPGAIRLFLNTAYLQCDPTKLEGTTAYALTHLLMSLPLKPNDFNDVKLVLTHVDFLTKILGNPHLSTDETLSMRGLQQLLMTLLSHLRAQDAIWDNALHRDETFNLNLLKWLKFNHDDPIEKQFLTRHILEQTSNDTHPVLINTDEYQNFIQQLLENPPHYLTETQFGGLFETLRPANQQKLANTILRQKALSDVQMGMLFTLSNALSARHLYEIFKISQTKYIFVDLIFRKDEATTDLTEAEQHELLSQIKSNRDITRLLNSYNPVSTKNKLVRAYFKLLGQGPTYTLDKLFLDEQSLVLLANYTTHPDDIKYLNAFITANDYQKASLCVALRAPSLDMEVQPESYLAEFIRLQWLNPWQGSFVHANYLTVLSAKDCLEAIKRRLLILSELDQLARLFEALSNAGNAQIETLLSVRYIHKLSLLTNTFLDIYLTWKTTSNTALKDFIEQTKLFHALISPLSQGESIFIENLNNRLVNLLDDYISTFPDKLDDTHKKTAKTGIRLYQHKLGHIKKYSSMRLWNLFSPQNAIAAIKGETLPQLHDLDSTAVTEASKLHQESLTKFQFDSYELRHELLSSLISTKLIEHPPVKRLIFDELLSQPRYSRMDDKLFNQIMSHFSPEECLGNVQRLNKKLLLIATNKRAITDTFKPLETKPLPVFIAALTAMPIETLNTWYDVMTWLNCHHFQDLILMAMFCKNIHFEPKQMALLFLPEALSLKNDTDGPNQDVAKLDTRFSDLLQMRQQIISVGFSLNNDSAFIDKKIASLSSNPLLPTLSENDLATIIESYHVLFTDKTKFHYQNAFVTQLILMLKQSKTLKPFLKHLSLPFKTQLINYALTQLSDNEFLVFSLISDMPSTTYSTLINPKNITTDLSYERQRLHFAVTPPENFPLKAQAIGFKNPAAQTIFMADAAFFYYWSTRPDSEKEAGKKALSWLQKKSLINYYIQETDMVEKELSTANKDFLHCWLKLRYFLALAYPDAQASEQQNLIETLLRWTKLYTSETQFKKDLNLHALLSYVIEVGLVKHLCQTITTKDLSDAPKYAWILHDCLDSKRLCADELSVLAPLCDPNKIMATLKSDPVYGVHLLQGLLQANLSPQQLPKALDLFNVLHTTSLDYNALIDCLDPVRPESLLQTLIASHLLMQQIDTSAYFQTLQTQTTPKPSPYQAIIQRINVNLLPNEVITLLPETVLLHLLVSVQTFFCLNQDKMKAILSTFSQGFYPFTSATKIWFIPFWLKQFQTAPDAATPVISFFNLERALVLKTLKDTPPYQCALIRQMLMDNSEALTEFNNETLDALIDICQECDLAYAIEHYLSGAMQGDIAKQWISKLTKKVLLQNALESNTIRLLIELSEKPSFAFLRKEISFFTGNTLRHYALNSDVSLFYHRNRVNTHRLHNILSYDPGTFVEPKQAASKQLSFGVWRNLTEFDTPLPPKIDKSIIEDMALFTAYDLVMRNIDYFLIHFKWRRDCATALNTLLTTYLEQLRQINSTLALLTFKSVDIHIRNTIFETLYQKTERLNAENAAYFVFHDAKKILQYHGEKGDYATVIMLSEAALKAQAIKFSPESLTHIKQALKEAKLELAISQFKHFITFRTWFWRCWTYGFTGWFKPKSPIFVMSFDPSKKAVLLLNETKPSHTKIVEALTPPVETTFANDEIIQDTSPWLTYFNILAPEKRPLPTNACTSNEPPKPWLYGFFRWSSTSSTEVKKTCNP